MNLRFKTLTALVLSIPLVSSAFALNLDEQVKLYEKEGWKVGLSVLFSDNRTISINGDKRFPLDSTVKSIACANVLAKVDAKKISLNHSMLVTKENMVTYSPVAQGYLNKSFTLEQACQAANEYSDNTAANFAILSGGGPEGLTAFMRSIGDTATRSDRYEPELTINPENDLRDTTTPDAMSRSLKEILTGEVLTQVSRNQLKEWMINNKVADNMLRASLPKGWKIADRSGASEYGVRGITSMVWSNNHEPVFISIYVRKEGSSLDERSEVIRILGSHIFNEYLNN
ncbi:TPA: class A beta-lactamase [Providencia rettgeri]|uniref:class A beta-lactamase n=1 Tax=Providencia TaxID=586 RepID=UPI001B944820|nr:MULTISPECIES: class A beta-lactamase [Providencia]MDK7744825.1 class A beta-lactamase [Providencia rettgeri]MDK7758697.1 class A beta-lactamase [Providencia rettgeri]HBC7430016.1 class A beta-lactamase [Providencia rettgeri]